MRPNWHNEIAQATTKRWVRYWLCLWAYIIGRIVYSVVFSKKFRLCNLLKCMHAPSTAENNSLERTWPVN